MQAGNEIIDVEAEAVEDTNVAHDVVENDIACLHGDGWNVEEESVDKSDPLMLSLEQWLGAEAVREMKASEIEALRRGVARLPEPEGEESFVWNAIRGPEDIEPVAEAIIEYRRFPLEAIVISDALGANSHLRKVVKNARLPVAVTLGEFMDQENVRVKALRKFMGTLESVQERMVTLFGEREFPVGAVLVALAAAPGLQASFPKFASGFDLPAPPHDSDLDVFDRLRRNVVGASDAVRKTCSVVPLRFSKGVLSGVRRSISERRAGDFVFAVQALGGVLESKQQIVDAGRAFSAYLTATDAFSSAVAAAGYEPKHEGAIIAHVLVRRHLRSAARELSVDWQKVSPFLSLRHDVEVEEFTETVTQLFQPGLSGRLKAVSPDLSRDVSAVLKVAHRWATEREYWLQAASRVKAVRPQVTLHEIRQVMEQEPAISASKDVLRNYGVTSREEVDPLERHLEWMISAYALPINDRAVERIIETRAGIIPLRLTAA